MIKIFNSKFFKSYIEYSIY